MRLVWLMAAVMLALPTVSCERDDEEEVPQASFPLHQIYVKWYFPVDSGKLWSGRTMNVLGLPSPVVTVDSVVPMRWQCDGYQFTALREDNDRVYKLQFTVLDVTDTSLTIEGAYGYVNGVNGSQWSGSGVVGHSWDVSATLVRDSLEYRMDDELF